MVAKTDNDPMVDNQINSLLDAAARSRQTSAPNSQIGALQQVAQSTKPNPVGGAQNIMGDINAPQMTKGLYGRFSGALEGRDGEDGLNAVTAKGLQDMLAGLKGYAPDPSEKWLNFAANIAKPTKFGTLGEVATNVASGLEPIVGKENALKNQYKQLALQMGYSVPNDLRKEAQEGQLKTLGMLDTMTSKVNGAFSNRPIKLGDGTWAQRDPQTGGFVPLAVSQQAALSKDYDTYYKIGEKILKTTDPSTLDAYAIDQISNKAAMRQVNPDVLNPGTNQERQVTPPPVVIPGQTASSINVEVPSGQDTPAMDQRMLALNAAIDKMNKAPLNSPDRTQAQQDVIALRKEAATTAAPGAQGRKPITNPDGTPLKLKSAPIEAGETKLAEQHALEAKEIAERATNLQNMASVVGDIRGEVAGLPPGNKMEPGKMSTFNMTALSWLKAAGVPIKPEDEDAIANNVALAKSKIKLAMADSKSTFTRPAVFDFLKTLESNPGPEMTVATINKLLGIMDNTISRGVQENQDFNSWHRDNPTAPVTEFSNYRNLLVTQPKWWQGYSDSFEKANGHPPTYEDINALAKQKGMTFSSYTNALHNAARKGAK